MNLDVGKQSDLMEIFTRLQNINTKGYDLGSSIKSKLNAIKYYEELVKTEEPSLKEYKEEPSPDDMINNIRSIIANIESNNEMFAKNLRHLSQII